MQFDISRDFLDGIMLGQPPRIEGDKELRANGGLHILPSSPDGTMHTVVVSLSLQVDGSDQPYARAGWRVLFTTDERFEPKENQAAPFLRGVLVMGASKIIALLNNLCMHANMPLIPFSAQQLAAQVQQQQQQGKQQPPPITP